MCSILIFGQDPHPHTVIENFATCSSMQAGTGNKDLAKSQADFGAAKFV